MALHLVIEFLTMWCQQGGNN